MEEVFNSFSRLEGFLFVVLFLGVAEKIVTFGREVDNENKYLALLAKHEGTLTELIECEETLKEREKFIDNLLEMEERVMSMKNKKKAVKFVKLKQKGLIK